MGPNGSEQVTYTTSPIMLTEKLNEDDLAENDRAAATTVFCENLGDRRTLVPHSRASLRATDQTRPAGNERQTKGARIGLRLT